MPADITGTSVFNPEKRVFEFRPGPVFADLLLADEINRAPAKTQAALLEAMQERRVTADGVSHRLPAVFTTLATQNPIEYEGTYPLPEAQLDRFMLKILVNYPAQEEERSMLARYRDGRVLHDVESLKLEARSTTDEIVGFRALLGQVDRRGSAPRLHLRHRAPDPELARDRGGRQSARRRGAADGGAGDRGAPGRAYVIPTTSRRSPRRCSATASSSSRGRDRGHENRPRHPRPAGHRQGSEMTFPSRRSVLGLAFCAIPFVLDLWIAGLWMLGCAALAGLALVVLLDAVFAPRKSDFDVSLKLSPVLSLGSQEPIGIEIRNRSGHGGKGGIRLELPESWAVGELIQPLEVRARGTTDAVYRATPRKRGKHAVGAGLVPSAFAAGTALARLPLRRSARGEDLSGGGGDQALRSSEPPAAHAGARSCGRSASGARAWSSRASARPSPDDDLRSIDWKATRAARTLHLPGVPDRALPEHRAHDRRGPDADRGGRRHREDRIRAKCRAAALPHRGAV
jgi:hypothetical protein